MMKVYYHKNNSTWKRFKSQSIRCLQTDESLVPPYALNYEAIELIYDMWIHRIIQTLMLIIPTSFVAVQLVATKKRPNLPQIV